MLDGTNCHLIKAAGQELDWQLWIDAGDKPLVRQFVPDLSKALELMAKQSKKKSPLESMKVTNVVTFNQWDTKAKFSPDAFVFKAQKTPRRPNP